MSLIRPEMRAALWRWREPLAALAVLALGLWWASASFGVMRWLGYALALIAAAAALAGVQRARFVQGRGGPGVVELDEGMLRYFGPFSGGVIDIPALSMVQLVPQAGNTHAWRLFAPGVPPLTIPTDAPGTELLFDVFAALPGVRIEAVLHHLHARSAETIVIWRHPATALH
ncbi:hypothetical protein [Actibacterium sp.]|uniref:hypothetical protein n=1 Tax=Actibacterium sp. TaxID=1872125 RepID=UPI003561D228